MNRINKWWEDVQKWKLQFEKVFGSNELKSNTFKKEELKKYEALLSGNKWKELSSDERMSRKTVQTRMNALQKELYPNPYQRLFVNAAKLATALVRKIIASNNNNKSQRAHQVSMKETLKDLGFGSIGSDVDNQLKAGIREFDLNIYSLSKSGALVDNKLLFTNTEGNKTELSAIVSRCTIEGGKKTISIKHNPNEFLSTDQIVSLSKGKVLKINDAWIKADLNDKDNDGNIKLKKMVIPDFDLKKEIQKLPIKNRTEQLQNEITRALENGERKTVLLSVNGIVKEIQIEAHPLMRKLEGYDNDKSISLTDLVGKKQKKPTLKILKSEKIAQRKALKL